MEPTNPEPAPEPVAPPAARAADRGAALRGLGLGDPPPLTVIREYKGKQQKDANSEFLREAQQFSEAGYVVTSQSWAQGQWGCGAWLVAVLCILLVGLGLLIIAYMVIVKPAGTLTVTYTLTD